jgi:hypothetical protein
MLNTEYSFVEGIALAYPIFVFVEFKNWQSLHGLVSLTKVAGRAQSLHLKNVGPLSHRPGNYMVGVPIIRQRIVALMAQAIGITVEDCP